VRLPTGRVEVATINVYAFASPIGSVFTLAALMRQLHDAYPTAWIEVHAERPGVLSYMLDIPPTEDTDPLGRGQHD
jgi:hypothetical protein